MNSLRICGLHFLERNTDRIGLLELDPLALGHGPRALPIGTQLMKAARGTAAPQQHRFKSSPSVSGPSASSNSGQRTADAMLHGTKNERVHSHQNILHSPKYSAFTPLIRHPTPLKKAITLSHLQMYIASLHRPITVGWITTELGKCNGDPSQSDESVKGCDQPEGGAITTRAIRRARSQLCGRPLDCK